ncbi:MAG: class I SAM-dependent methyltransferase [Acidobacteriota bacterium]
MDAAEYDSWYDSPLGADCLESEIKLLRRGAGDLKGKAILEVGCGTGRFLLAIGQEAIWAAGIDRDLAALNFARCQSPAKQEDHFDWIEGDAQAIPFPDGTFDVVFETTLLCFCNDPAPVICEMVRVCRPGGRVLLGELNPFSPWQWWRRLKTVFDSGPFAGASWHRPQNLLAALAASGCQTQWVGRAIFWPPFNVTDVLGWRSATEWLGSRLWPWAGSYYVVRGIKRPGAPE